MVRPCSNNYSWQRWKMEAIQGDGQGIPFFFLLSPIQSWPEGNSHTLEIYLFCVNDASRASQIAHTRTGSNMQQAFAYAKKYHRKSTHTHTHYDNKFGCSSTIHYAWIDPGGWGALFSSLVVPVPHCLSSTMKRQNFTSKVGWEVQGVDFKGWRWFPQIVARCGIATTHAMQLSVQLDFTDSGLIKDTVRYDDVWGHF